MCFLEVRKFTETTHPRSRRAPPQLCSVHMRLLLDGMTGAQSVIQSDKLPVAGIEPRQPSRIATDVWPVGPDHLSWRSDEGPSRPVADPPLTCFGTMRRGSRGRKQEGLFGVKFKKMGSWAFFPSFSFSVHFQPGTKPRLHAALMPIKGLNQAASLQARAQPERLKINFCRRHGRMWPRASVRSQKISDCSDLWINGRLAS